MKIQYNTATKEILKLRGVKNGKDKYGKELIMDLHKYDPSTFTRESIEAFFIALCEKIDMQREDLHFWDYDGDIEAYNKAPDHLKGISAIQFIRTSNITIHTLDKLGKVFLNIFSCKVFCSKTTVEFATQWFGGEVITNVEVDRI